MLIFVLFIPTHLFILLSKLLNPNVVPLALTPYNQFPLFLTYTLKLGAAGESGVVTTGLGSSTLGGKFTGTVMFKVGVDKVGIFNVPGPATFIAPMLTFIFGSFTVTVISPGAVGAVGSVTVGVTTVGVGTFIVPTFIEAIAGDVTGITVGAAGTVKDTFGTVGSITTGAFTTGSINSLASASYTFVFK